MPKSENYNLDNIFNLDVKLAPPLWLRNKDAGMVFETNEAIMSMRCKSIAKKLSEDELGLVFKKSQNGKYRLINVSFLKYQDALAAAEKEYLERLYFELISGYESEHALAVECALRLAQLGQSYQPSVNAVYALFRNFKFKGTKQRRALIKALLILKQEKLNGKN